MKTHTMAFALAACGAALGTTWLHAQGRGGAEWTTSQYDAQRSGSIGNDPRISLATMQKPGDFGPFKFLWKLKLEYEPNASTALTQPVLLDRIIGFRGFKSIAFVGTGSETIHAIDVDFGVTLWKYHINYTASPPPVAGNSTGCPGGLTTPVSRPTAIAPPAIGGGGGGARGGRSGGGVGEPGRGALTLGAAAARAAGPGGAGAAPGAPARGVVPGSAAAAAGAVPGALPAGARAGGGGGGGRGGFQPGDDAAYVIGSDGYLHALNVQNAWDLMTPALFLPANTRAAGLIVATGPSGPTAYVATTHGCGSQPDGVWAMDLASPQKTVTAFQPKGANIAGSSGLALGRDGRVFVATTDGTAAQSNALIALEPKTLSVQSSVVVPRAAFTSSPLLFQSKGKDLIVVAGGGKVMLFDSAALERGPIATSTTAAAPEADAGALTSWLDAQGAQWIAAPAARGIVALKVVDTNGTLSLAPGWTSREIAAPATPIVINGVLFAAAKGTRAVPGTLYAIDAATGKDLWNSAKTITSMVQGGLSGGQGNVYVPTADGTLYAFGFAIEK